MPQPDLEYNRIQAAKMTEAAFQAAIIGFAQRVGWMVYHTYDSRRSEPGYPDLHLVHPVQGRSLFRELKTQKGKLTPPQQKWQAALKDVGADVDVWRPADWFDNTIANQLTHAPPTGQASSTVIFDEMHDHETLLGVELQPWQRAIADEVLNPDRITNIELSPPGRTADRARFERFLLDKANATTNPKEQ